MQIVRKPKNININNNNNIIIIIYSDLIVHNTCGSINKLKNKNKNYCLVVAHVHGLPGQWHFGVKDFRVKTKTTVHLAGVSRRHVIFWSDVLHIEYMLWSRDFWRIIWQRGPVFNTYFLWSVFVELTSERKKKPSTKEARRTREERIRSHRQISKFDTSFSFPESLQYLPSLWTLRKPFDRCIDLCFLLGFEEIRVFFWMFWSWFLCDGSPCCCDREEDRVRFVETSKRQISRVEEARRGGGGGWIFY